MSTVLARLELPALPCWPAGGWLVGGAVRDLLLGFEPQDYDFVSPDPHAAAEDCARAVAGSVFPLDDERGHWRVVANSLTYDFAPLLGGLETELARRDYSVNALAANHRGLVFGPPPARADLATRRLRALSRANLADDPLRPLRGWRLWVTHGLRPEPLTRRWIFELAQEQRFGRQPAAERIREELNQVLLGERAAWGFTKLAELGLAAAYLREWHAGAGVEQGGYHHLDVLGHELETLFQLIWRFPNASLELRWAALLHDIGKPLVRQWDEKRGYYRFFDHESVGAVLAAELLRRLRYPRPTALKVRALVERHMKTPPASARGLRRWLGRDRALLPDLLLLQIADRAATRGPLAARLGDERLRALYRALAAANAFLREKKPARLLSGSELIELLGLEPGPIVGWLLKELTEAQLLGDVHSRDEAIEFVKWKYEAEAAETGRPANAGGDSPQRPAGD